MDFGQALAELKAGKPVTREGWNGKGQFLDLQSPDENQRGSLPYISITTVQGDQVPWVASQSDLLAEDWQLEPWYSLAGAVGEYFNALFGFPLFS